jgi:hypothetical protein
VLDRLLAALTIPDFLLGEHALQKQFAVPLDHLTDAYGFDDVCPESDNHGGS